jgi:DNA-binding MarR family transcriptional regulator
MPNEMRNSLSYLLARICRAHRQNAYAKLAEIDLHVGQDMFLLQLWCGDGIPQSELARRAGVQPATVTTMAQRMERSGLVVRQKDESDSRVTLVYLTQAGWQLRHDVAQVWQEIEAQLAAGLTREEKETLRRLLHKVYRNIIDDVGPNGCEGEAFAAAVSEPVTVEAEREIH